MAQHPNEAELERLRREIEELRREIKGIRATIEESQRLLALY